VSDILEASSREIVEDDDVVSSVEKSPREVRSDESGTPGDQNTHELVLLIVPPAAVRTMSNDRAGMDGTAGSAETAGTVRSSSGEFPRRAAAGANDCAGADV
jgi:hypothetical protein